jgi:hypothetical protein
MYLMPKGALQQQMSKLKNATAVAKIDVGNTTVVSGRVVEGESPIQMSVGMAARGRAGALIKRPSRF